METENGNLWLVAGDRGVVRLVKLFSHAGRPPACVVGTISRVGRLPARLVGKQLTEDRLQDEFGKDTVSYNL